MEYFCPSCETTKNESEFYFRQKPGRKLLKDKKCKTCILARQSVKDKERYSEMRSRVLEHYGGNKPRCQCCGENNKEFLVIDHINGGGNEHRKEVGENMVRWIIKNNFPPEFRVLCANCNTSIGVYGYCPHSKNA